MAAGVRRQRPGLWSMSRIVARHLVAHGGGTIVAETLSRRVATLGSVATTCSFLQLGGGRSAAVSQHIRTRVWLPALERAGLEFHVRFLDLT
jgi:hypothetical protein